MIIKNKKTYMICLLVCVAMNVLGMLLPCIKALAGLGDVLNILSWVLGIVVGSMRTYKEWLKYVFRKKDSRIIGISIMAIFFLWWIKLCWWIFAIGIGFVVCLALPVVSATLAYIRHKDELIEA